MPLQKQMIPVPLDGGVDTKTDDKLVLPASLVTVENGVFQKGGTVSKRNGYSNISTSSLDVGDTPLQVFESDEKLYLITENNSSSRTLYQFNGTSFDKKTEFEQYRIKHIPVGSALITDSISGAATKHAGDSAVFGNLVCCVWSDIADDGLYGVLRFSIIDMSTEAVLYSGARSLGTTNYPIETVRCLYLAGNFHVFYKGTSVGTTGIIRTFTISTTGSVGSDALVSGLGATPVLDFAVNLGESSSIALLAYVVTATGAVNISFYDGNSLNPANYPGALTIDTTATNINVSFGVSPYLNKMVLCFQRSVNTAFYTVRSYTTGGGAAWTTLQANTGITTTPLTPTPFRSSTRAFTDPLAITGSGTYIGSITLEGTMTSAFSEYVTYTAFVSDSYTLTFSPSNYMPNTFLASEFYPITGVASTVSARAGVYFAISKYTNQETYYLLDHLGNVLGKIFDLEAKIQSNYYEHMIVSINQCTNGKIVLLVPRYQAGTTQLFSLVFFDPSDVYFSSTRFNTNTYITSGFLSKIDKTLLIESGFFLYPEISNGAPAGGGSIADGTYLYTAIFTYVDQNGSIHQSAEALPLTVVVARGGNSSVAISARGICITRKKYTLVEVYRTTASGTLYYRVGSASLSTSAGSTFTTSVSITDTYSDAQLTAKAPLYTTGGILANDLCPACGVVSTYKDRLITDSLNKAGRIYYSKILDSGYNAEFNSALVIDTQKGERLTGLLDLEDKLYIFSQDSINLLYGEGANNLGESDSFSRIYPIETPFGCESEKSLVKTRNAIFYKSTYSGIYMISGGQAQYIGAPIEDYVTGTITSTLALPDREQIRFLHSSGNYCFVFDTYFNKWSVFTNHGGLSQVYYNGSYYYLLDDSSVTVYKESSSSYADNATYYDLAVRTGWIKTNGITGLQRIYRAAILGDYKSGNTGYRLKVVTYYDYNETAVDTYYITLGTIAASETAFMQRLHLAQQKCEAISFRVEEEATAQAVSQWAKILGLQLEVGIKPQFAKLQNSLSV